jgi:hypothetical protein
MHEQRTKKDDGAKEKRFHGKGGKADEAEAKSIQTS